MVKKSNFSEHLAMLGTVFSYIVLPLLILTLIDLGWLYVKALVIKHAFH